ncbi:ATP-binding protein [Clostridium sp. SHJSY1]|uniref:AAA family ATPase n=1 Tax=Clostridium sp. SHJSY1 TaxID=2942483 RepID=UPI0028753E63|nr:AAA family ATPase [Clostridium sp. SHJSY1]MDS0525488.1 ATP-binding protein [Clostridium sp. SHJSY1]
MSKLIGIMGESGAGKTTSLRTLDPKTTYIIDADKKGLSWKGWKQQYSVENKNYIAADDPLTIRGICKNINDKAAHVKTVVIDTLNGAMVADEMRRSKEKGYDKWMDLAACVWNVVDDALTYRDDLTFIFICHSQTDMNENGYMWTRIKTSGKKLDKIVLESKFNTVLLAKCVDGKHIFETQSNFSTAKSPLGAFENMEIDNNMADVLKALEEF